MCPVGSLSHIYWYFFTFIWIKVLNNSRPFLSVDGIRSDNTETIINEISNNNNSNNQTTSDVTPSNINNSVDDKSHSTSLIRTNKILRGFKQWLQRPVGVNNNNINSNNNASSTSNSISTNGPSVGSINFSTANNPTNTMNNIVTSTTGYFSGSCGSTTTSSVNYHNVNSNNNWDISSTVDVSHSESPNNEHKFSSLMTGMYTYVCRYTVCVCVCVCTYIHVFMYTYIRTVILFTIILLNLPSCFPS